MNRGDVYLVSITLPNRSGGAGGERDKWVVCLQGGPAFNTASDIAVLVASTHRGGVVRPFEVLCGVQDGFRHETIIDCRWPFTVAKAKLVGGTFKMTLNSLRMRDVSLGLVNGLQLR